MENAKKAKKDPSMTREGLLYLAELAAGANRFEDSFQYMKNLVKIVGPTVSLTDKERRCFFSACMFVIPAQLHSYHTVAEKVTDSPDVDKRRPDAAINNYLQLITSEVCKTCTDVVRLIDIYFLPASYSSSDSKVFYKNLKGDVLKNMAEVKEGPEKDKLLMDAFGAYMSAKDDEDVLSATNPSRLRLNLSLALYYFEIRGSRTTAFSIANEAVDLATKELEATEQIASEETTKTLRCLRNCMDLVTEY